MRSNRFSPSCFAPAGTHSARHRSDSLGTFEQNLTTFDAAQQRNEITIEFKSSLGILGSIRIDHDQIVAGRLCAFTLGAFYRIIHHSADVSIGQRVERGMFPRTFNRICRSIHMRHGRTSLGGGERETTSRVKEMQHTSRTAPQLGKGRILHANLPPQLQKNRYQPEYATMRLASTG